MSLIPVIITQNREKLDLFLEYKYNIFSVPSCFHDSHFVNDNPSIQVRNCFFGSIGQIKSQNDVKREIV